MILAWLLLLTGLTISAVAIYYSVVGLAAIFSAAVIPIIVMGSALEVAKLVCASWLKANWSQAPRLMKIYMTTAVAVLMLITSMGIFGFLSKAHSDQSLVSGDVMSKISIYDEKIKIAKDNIDANRKALKQMDEAVDQVMVRSTSETGADKAVGIRRSQQKERSRLQSEIAAEQKTITSLNEERAPIAAEVRKVEAEVGPLKYIAAFVYGATDENVLERAVTWVIITIIVVFDPLAVIMLLAAQMTFGWKKEEVEPALVPVVDIISPETTSSNEPKYELDDGPLTADQIEQIKASTQFVDFGEHPQDTFEHEHTEDEVTSETPSTALGGDITAPEEPVVPNTTESELDKWNKMIEEAEKEVAKENISTVEERVAKGETYIDQEGQEVPLDESKKKDLHDEGPNRQDPSEEQGNIGYIQNSEQGEETIWSRIVQRTGARAKDELYKLHSSKAFESLEVDEVTDPDLFKFVKETLAKGPKFSNYSADKIEHFVSRIYELRKDNSNNTAG